ncbi:MAG: DEAD/DEAH box helicase [Verrucomicrobia bacterium]|nr:DEAD/DEAH box helicase [Verrucomicrobiota bacterium]
MEVQQPIPHLRLYGLTPGGRPRHEVGYSPMDLDAVGLHFDYGGTRVSPVAGGVAAATGGKDADIPRNFPAEQAAVERLKAAGFRPLVEVSVGLPRPELRHDWSLGSKRELWLKFALEILPEWKQAGWQVETEPSFQYQMVHPNQWYVETGKTDRQGWLSFELGILIDEQRINLLPSIVNLLRGCDPRLLLNQLRSMDAQGVFPVPLADGRLLPFPAHRLVRILEVLVELHGRHALAENGKMRLNQWRAGELAFLDKDHGIRWFGSREIQELGRRLLDFKGPQALSPPKRFHGILRPYQREGLGWLQFLRQYQLPGILADDMGLGKTVQALAHLCVEKSAGRLDRPALVVAPTSLMTNWKNEARRFAPGLKTHVSHGLDRREKFHKLSEHDLIITSYPLLHRDHQVLLEHEYHCLILDEAQMVKNPKTFAAQVCVRINARQRLCLTGTPVENHLGELWSLFNILLTGFLGSANEFNELFRIPIEKERDHVRQETLNRRIRPFVLRRKKEQVEKDLPPKTEVIERVELGEAQRDLYETIRVAMHQRVADEIRLKGVERSHIVILDALLKMRQVCCDPRLVKLGAASKVRESAKFEFLFGFLEELLEEDRKIILFSQFTSMLALIEKELERRSVSYVKLTGQTRDRATPIAAFQEGKVPLFLVSLKAGGLGLNLTAADTVILYDPWWNPAVEEQAAARAHRIGQTKPIFVYKLVVANTVEERILELQKHKKELANALFEQETISKLHLGKEDFEALFKPLK